MRAFQSTRRFLSRQPKFRADLNFEPLTIASNIQPDPLSTLFTWEGDRCQELILPDREALIQHLANKPKDQLWWIDIEGRGDSSFLQTLGQALHLHELEIEDIGNLHQRPKVEEYDNHLFVVSRMLYFCKDDGRLMNEQVSFLIFDQLVVTIQEEKDDDFDLVRERLRKNRGNVWQQNAFFLAFLLMDAIVDHYFPMMERIGNSLDALEEKLLAKASRGHLDEIQQLKREVFFLKKAIWAERDKINELVRSSFGQIDEKARVYLRDTYDHTVQVMDIVESHREVAFSLMELYLSSVNNRLSEVMKVLTVISSIFIPLTFVVGVYGMNFSRNGKDGQELPWNMPELYSPYGYLGVMGFMAILAFGEIYYFRKKGWL